jgi:FKBP-type peptidyl-prolyl cis-trans isomerase
VEPDEDAGGSTGVEWGRSSPVDPERQQRVKEKRAEYREWIAAGNKREKGLEKRMSKAGFTIEKLEEGTGPKIRDGDMVTMHVKGYLPDSNMKLFMDTTDSVIGKPIQFIVGERAVVTGLDLAASHLFVGDKARISISPKYGYRKAGYPRYGVPPHAALLMEVEVLEKFHGGKTRI